MGWRLKEFKIYYSDKTVWVSNVEDAVKVELEGPDALLGYRVMQKKLRQVCNLWVPQDLVHCLDPEHVLSRPRSFRSSCPLNKKKERKGNFSYPRLDMVHSLDGHGKLMRYQINTFPIAIYDCTDTTSRKLLWLKVWTSSSK